MAIIDELFYRVGYQIDQASVSKLKASFQSVADIGTKIAGFATVASAAVTFLVDKTFVATASQFEQYKTILETTERSQEGAKKAMDWVSNFATKTPYELNEVMASFVKLRAYGLEPTNGLLETLGDTAAAMGKPIMMAVEAIADAVAGENERLKEFGIKARKAGGEIAYEYVDSTGKQMVKTVDASNRAMIQSTLEAIMNEKYHGQMNKLSATWKGLTSNISDQWTRFQNMAMDSGAFDFMKQRAQDVLDLLNQMAADGRLAKYAKETGDAIVDIAKGVWLVIKAVAYVAGVVKTAIDWLGGFEETMRLVFLGTGVYVVYTLGSALITFFATAGAAAMPLILTTLLWAAAFAAVIVVLDDIWAWIEGRDSIAGRLFGDFSVFKAKAIGALEDVKKAMIDLWNNPLIRGLVGAAAGAAVGGPIGALVGLAGGMGTAVAGVGNIDYKSPAWASGSVPYSNLAKPLGASSAAGVNSTDNSKSVTNHIVQNISGVSDPLDSANMFKKALTQEVDIGTSSYGVLQR